MNKEIERREEVGNQLPTIQEEGGSELRMAISEILDNDGGQSPTPSQQETNKTLGNFELGWGDVINIAGIDGGSWGRTSWIKRRTSTMCEKEREGRRTTGSNGIGPTWRSHFGPTSAENEGK